MNTTSASSGGPLRVGDPFPDVELVDHTGAAWRPGDVRGRPLVLILHRHLG